MIWKLFFGFCYFHVSYFDCTNFYFDIGRSDMDTFDDNGNPIDKKGNPTELKYRKQEPEKNHSRVDAPLTVVRPSQNPDLHFRWSDPSRQ